MHRSILQRPVDLFYSLRKILPQKLPRLFGQRTKNCATPAKNSGTGYRDFLKALLPSLMLGFIAYAQTKKITLHNRNRLDTLEMLALDEVLLGFGWRAASEEIALGLKPRLLAKDPAVYFEKEHRLLFFHRSENSLLLTQNTALAKVLNQKGTLPHWKPLQKPTDLLPLILSAHAPAAPFEKTPSPAKSGENYEIRY